MRIAVIILMSFLLPGCVQFPAGEDATDQSVRDASYPSLVPLDQIADRLAGPDTPPLETSEQLETRVNGLKSRADRLRGPVLSETDRTRLEETPQ